MTWVAQRWGHDPFPDPSTVFVPGVETTIEAKEIQRQESAEKAANPPVQHKPLRKSNRQQGISPDSDLAQHWSLSTNVDEIEHASYQQAEYAFVTGEHIGSIGAGTPGEIGFMSPDPRTYDDAVSGDDEAGWRASMAEERRSLIEHDVFEWVDPPEGIQAIPSRFLYRWKYNQDGVACRHKSRVVVRGFHEADTEADKAAPVASQESVHILIANAAMRGLIPRQLDIKTAFLQARMRRDDPDVYVIPAKGFECQEEQANQVWRLKAWLYGLRLSPRGWWGTMHTYLLEMGLTSSIADPCVYNLGEGAVLLLRYVDGILLSGSDSEQVLNVI